MYHTNLSVAPFEKLYHFNIMDRGHVFGVNFDQDTNNFFPPGDANITTIDWGEFERILGLIIESKNAGNDRLYLLLMIELGKAF